MKFTLWAVLLTCVINSEPISRPTYFLEQGFNSTITACPSEIVLQTINGTNYSLIFRKNGYDAVSPSDVFDKNDIYAEIVQQFMATSGECVKYSDEVLTFVTSHEAFFIEEPHRLVKLKNAIDRNNLCPGKDRLILSAAFSTAAAAILGFEYQSSSDFSPCINEYEVNHQIRKKRLLYYGIIFMFLGLVIICLCGPIKTSRAVATPKNAETPAGFLLLWTTSTPLRILEACKPGLPYSAKQRMLYVCGWINPAKDDFSSAFIHTSKNLQVFTFPLRSAIGSRWRSREEAVAFLEGTNFSLLKDFNVKFFDALQGALVFKLGRSILPLCTPPPARQQFEVNRTNIPEPDLTVYPTKLLGRRKQPTLV